MKGEKKASLSRRPTDPTPFSSSSPGCQSPGESRRATGLRLGKTKGRRMMRCHQQPPEPPSSCLWVGSGQPTSHLPTLGTPAKCLQDIQVVPRRTYIYLHL